MSKNTSEDSFSSDISSGLVFVDFWAEWCGPCKAIAPQYDALSKTHTTASFLKLDIMSAQETVKHHNVRNIPTVIAFLDGVEMDLRLSD